MSNNEKGDNEASETSPKRAIHDLSKKELFEFIADSHFDETMAEKIKKNREENINKGRNGR